MPQKPWPPERIFWPRMLTSMSSQWLKAPRICAAVSGSAACRLPSVWSEKTTPQPKVSYGLLRSTTTISCEGSCFFISSAKYRPEGPPPMQTIFTSGLNS